MILHCAHNIDLRFMNLDTIVFRVRYFTYMNMNIPVNREETQSKRFIPNRCEYII